MAESRPILCLDWDGVIHSYTSGWKGADVIPDPPVDGAMKFIWDAQDHFKVAIFSSRSNQDGGRAAMQAYLDKHFRAYFGADFRVNQCDDRLTDIAWPVEKPPAFLSIDDRALTFEGTWPDIEKLKAFQPWNKRLFGATGTFPQGKLSDNDEGALKMGVAFDKLNGVVIVDFGKPVKSLGLPPPQAIQLAQLLMRNAGVKKIQLEL